MNHCEKFGRFNKIESFNGDRVDYVWISEVYAVEETGDETMEERVEEREEEGLEERLDRRLLSRIQHFYYSSPDIARSFTRAEFEAFCKESGNYVGLTNLCRYFIDRCSKEEEIGSVLWDFEDKKATIDCQPPHQISRFQPIWLIYERAPPIIKCKRGLSILSFNRILGIQP
jgi:hypothetical protein